MFMKVLTCSKVINAKTLLLSAKITKSNLHGLLEKGFENDNVSFTAFQLHFRSMCIYKKFKEIKTYLQLCIICPLAYLTL